ncbi:MAG: hypothetical protein HF308_15375 [Ignavibacteria bacterium]|jgi:hypothetical protein|nr:hypothetical protein [Ignavibacteria bacterium]MCU7525859.1 hypothetical protein [Ignavibacteria bacterium]
MIFKFKDYNLSNSISVFNHYKRITGNSLEKDLRRIEQREKILKDPKATEAQRDAAMDIDEIEIIQYVYCAMRCAGEAKPLDIEATVNEIDVADLVDGKLQEAILKLVDVKKNTGLLAKIMKR